MSRTRRIRQFLDPDIAKREVKNISQIYQAMGYDVNVSTDTENGSIVHRIIANKGKHSSIIVELYEVESEVKKDKSEVFEETPLPELAESSADTDSREAEVPAPSPPESIIESTTVKVTPESPQLKSLRKEDIEEYAEHDETGIVPALVAEGALVIEDGSIKIKKWIAREQFLHAREYFNRVGLRL